jgi:hypothetical protein
MSYTIALSPDGKYIIVQVIVEMTRELALEVASQGFAMGQELGIDRYLLDLTQSRNRGSIFDSYESAHSDLANLARYNKLSQAAMLVAAEDHSHDFNETVRPQSVPRLWGHLFLGHSSFPVIRIQRHRHAASLWRPHGVAGLIASLGCLRISFSCLLRAGTGRML